MSNKIPWQDRPAGCNDVLWRYSENPIIGRYDIPSSNSIFNSAVVPFGDGYAGVFRCDNKAVQMNIFAGFSKDGLHWEINHDPIVMKAGNTSFIPSDYKYDPRVTFIEDRYWVTWCNGYCGPTIGIAYTYDFKEFFQCTKIGAGAVPIKTAEGWLLFYHGVINTCNGFRYSMGAALLDLEDPSRVIARTQPYLLAPATLYETTGDVPNVVFPCAALHSTEEDKVAVYYGAADTVVGVAFGHISEIVKFTKENSL